MKYLANCELFQVWQWGYFLELEDRLDRELFNLSIETLGDTVGVNYLSQWFIKEPP